MKMFESQVMKMWEGSMVEWSSESHNSFQGDVWGYNGSFISMYGQVVLSRWLPIILKFLS
jgi:hypothetical protein